MSRFASAATYLPATRRSLSWISHLAHGRVAIYLIALGVAAYGVVVRCSSLGRSLWLDEAWVANSILAKSLAGMFYYAAWLQSTPPLFLLLARTTVSIFGLSNAVLRIVPSFMGIVAMLCVLLLSARILLRQYALLAWSLFVLSANAVEFSRTFKQYSSELAATAAILFVSALYIQNAIARRFWLLLVTVMTGLLLAYAVAFLLPGIALVIWMSPIRRHPASDVKSYMATSFRRALLFTAIAGGTLIGEYRLFVTPNSPQVLHAEWAQKNRDIHSFAKLATDESYDLIGDLPLNHRLQQKNVRLGAVGLVIALGFAFAWLRFLKGRRKWLQIQIACILPCILLIISDWFEWYPFVKRTRLFLLPCVIALLVLSLQLVSFYVLKKHRDWVRPFLDIALLGAIVLTIHAGRSISRWAAPVEEMDEAVSYLRTHVQPRDFLWVHASCSEGFKLYATMNKWQDAPAHFGKTAWPCCPRGIPDANVTSSELLVRNDLGRALPSSFSGRVWLLYTLRPEHWKGFANEPEIMRAIVRERDCTAMPTPAFFNVAVSSFDCKGRAVVELP